MFTAAFAHLYAIAPPLPLSLMLPIKLVTISTFPLLSFSFGVSAFVTRIGPSVFTSNARCITRKSSVANFWSSNCSSQLRPGLLPRPPALLITASTRTPSSARASRSPASSAVTSTSWMICGRREMQKKFIGQLKGHAIKC
jgi:hypothetical protein